MSRLHSLSRLLRDCRSRFRLLSGCLLSKILHVGLFEGKEERLVGVLQKGMDWGYA